MIDLNQVSLALRNSTERSLILLDEFGKGTAAAGSYISGSTHDLTLVKTKNRRIFLLALNYSFPTRAVLSAICLGLNSNRWCRHLCRSLEASTFPRPRLPKSDSHDTLSRTIHNRRARPSRTTHHFHPYGDHVRHAYWRDHRRRLDYDNQG